MHFPDLIQDLAVILGVAAIVTFIFRRIKQPVVLGYIIAGVIVGPHTPAVFKVTDMVNIQVWAELGVIFLMFTLGLEFSFRRLARVGMSAGIAGSFQIVIMMTVGNIIAGALGWTNMDGVFLGCMIAVSSTTIIIKALDELGLKTRRFADLVFGILIVEDLAAILMMVALTNIAKTSEIGGVELLLAGGKLALVVGAWFVVGMFLVPRFVTSVSRYGNDEMMTVVAIGLCLALVALAAYFHYSVALGAFIMGSILAESSEAKRIEHLVQPLKDIFGAVFFVSVGMLLNPQTIVDNLGAVALLTTIVIGGNLAAVSLGALASGQTIRNAIQTGFSMGQIGEFSFIIAALGLSFNAISPEIYPIVVAVSLITTFTTPYLIRSSGNIATKVEAWLPKQFMINLNNYTAWIQRRSVSNSHRKIHYVNLTKWLLNAIVVITLFTLSAERLYPLLLEYAAEDYISRTGAWLAAFVLSAPSIWAMTSVFREAGVQVDFKRTLPKGGALLVSRILTVGLVGLLSVAFFPALITLIVTIGLCGAVFYLFRRQVEGYYRWIERQFQSGFQADLTDNSGGSRKAFDRLAPWDAHLVEVRVPARSFLAGRSLIDLKLRERYGINAVVIVRDDESIVAPKATEVLYPSDKILCFATDAELERFRDDIETHRTEREDIKSSDAYELRRIKVKPTSTFVGRNIRQSGIREKFDCIVVGLEREGKQIRSPSSETPLSVNDVIWTVGETKNLKLLESEFS